MDKEVKDKTIDTIIDIIFYVIAMFTGEELSQRLFHSDNIRHFGKFCVKRNPNR